MSTPLPPRTKIPRIQGPWAAALCLLGTLACAPELPPPEPPTAAPTRADAEEPTPEAPPTPTKPNPKPGKTAKTAPLKFGPYYQLWEQKPPGWSHAVAVLPTGDVAMEQGGTLYVFRRHDGALIEKAGICNDSTDTGLALGGKGLVLVCKDGVHELAIPGLMHQLKVPTPFANPQFFRNSHINGQFAAMANQAGDLAIVSLRDWKVVAQWKVPKQTFSPSVVVSRDGRSIAVGIDTPDSHNETWIFTRGRAGHTKAPMNKPIRFSPKGKFLFGQTSSFRAGVLDLATGAVGAEHPAGSWTNAARYLRPTWLVSGGSDAAATACGGIPTAH